MGSTLDCHPRTTLKTKRLVAENSARTQEGDAMTKAELLDAIAKGNADMTKKQVTAVVDAVFDTITSAIGEDGEFSFPGFGSFRVRERKARMGRNPQTGETLKIKASKTVGFKAAKALKEAL